MRDLLPGIALGIFLGSVVTILGILFATVALDFHLCPDETPPGVAGSDPA